MSEVKDWTETTLARTPIDKLLDDRARAVERMKGLAAIIDGYNSRVEKLLRLHKLEAVKVGRWQPRIVTPKSGRRKPIDPKKLLELGVAAKVIALATPPPGPPGAPYFRVFDLEAKNAGWGEEGEGE